MADGPGNNGSAKGRGNSRVLAESMSNLLINDSGVNNLDFCTEDISKYVENLNSEIAKTSSDAVIQKLTEDTSQKLNHIRDRLHSYCMSQWPECPKENLSRRITRTGGRTVVEKLATDITILAKFGSSGEQSQELVDIFQKPRTSENNLA